MAAPTITSPSPSFEQIASGVAYSRTLTASNTPTSWSSGGLPEGLTIDNSGVISGTPTATSPSSHTVTVTASNFDGDSAELQWIIVVLPSIVGVTAGGFRIPVNLDLASRKLSLPGVGSPQPGNQPPTIGERIPLATWVEGERFTLSLGIEMAGVLQEIGLNRVHAYWCEAIGERVIPLHEDETNVTETGSGSTARYEVPMFLDSSVLGGILSSYEADTGIRANGYLQIVAESSTDASDFSYSSSQAISAMTASDSDAKTFAVTLNSTEVTPLEYRVTLTLNNVPGGVSCVRDLTVHYNSGGSTYVVDTNTGDSSDVGAEVSEGYFTPTLTVTSITATSSGLSIVATATTSTNSHAGKNIDLLANFVTNSDLFEIVAGEVTGVTGTLTLTLKDSGASTIGSITVANGDSAADLLAKLETATSETLVAVTFPNSTTIRIIFESGTAVDDHDFGSEIALGTPASYPPVLSLTNTSITCDVVGLEMPELFNKITSQIVPLDIEASLEP